mmetsp:Transcript_19573/g.75149  ORF Transcript_19573/g.75149 Transcript_19573/m.75149 type:complete len:515 (+) Transcript_19573:232-1776(+)
MSASVVRDNRLVVAAKVVLVVGSDDNVWSAWSTIHHEPVQSDHCVRKIPIIRTSKPFVGRMELIVHERSAALLQKAGDRVTTRLNAVLESKLAQLLAVSGRDHTPGHHAIDDALHAHLHTADVAVHGKLHSRHLCEHVWQVDEKRVPRTVALLLAGVVLQRVQGRRLTPRFLALLFDVAHVHVVGAVAVDGANHVEVVVVRTGRVQLGRRQDRRNVAVHVEAMHLLQVLTNVEVLRHVDDPVIACQNIVPLFLLAQLTTGRAVLPNALVERTHDGRIVSINTVHVHVPVGRGEGDPLDLWRVLQVGDRLSDHRLLQLNPVANEHVSDHRDGRQQLEVPRDIAVLGSSVAPGLLDFNLGATVGVALDAEAVLLWKVLEDGLDSLVHVRVEQLVRPAHVVPELPLLPRAVEPAQATDTARTGVASCNEGEEAVRSHTGEGGHSVFHVGALLDHCREVWHRAVPHRSLVDIEVQAVDEEHCEVGRRRGKASTNVGAPRQPLPANEEHPLHQHGSNDG